MQLAFPAHSRRAGVTAAASAAILVASLAFASAQQSPPPPGAPAGMRPGEAPPGMPPGGPPPMPSVDETTYNSAIRIENGVYQKGKSTRSAVKEGKVDDTFANGVAIASDADDFNGVFVKGGKSAFTLSHSTIDLSGTGHNDFLGLGAGAMVVGGVLVLDDVKITTNGPISSATIATGESVLKVYGSTLNANGGALPADYKPRIGPGMMEPPAPLGLEGNARAHITMGNSKSYFYDSTIIADGWGALSTDATGGGVYVEANNCDIKVNKRGYGTYADFGAHVVFNNTRVNSGAYAGIIAGAARIDLNDVTGVEAKSAVMIHSVMGRPDEIGELTIKGGHIETGEAAVLVKSANVAVTIDGAEIVSKSGELLKAIVNDDPNATKTNGAKVPGVKAVLKNGRYSGSVADEDTARGLSLALVGASLEGAVKNASLSVDKDSRWTATGDSSVTLVGPVDLAAVDAPPGVVITARRGPGNALKGVHPLAGGGVLKIVK